MQGGAGKNHPSPPGLTEIEKSGVCEGAQVSTTTPPTRMDIDSRAAKSELREGTR